MKKKLVLFLVLSMVILAFSACGGGTTETPAEETPTADVVKTGLAVITSTAKSADAGDENGVAQVDSTAVALMLDDSGTIVNCVIDSAQTMIEFSKQGRIVTPLDSVFPAKQELGEEYGMGEASTIGKEWNEQADALSSYVIGKTFDEVKSIAVNEEGNPTDEDLASSVTIKIGGFIDAIEKAAANARNLGAAFNDKLGLGIVTTIANSADAGEEDGVAQAYTYYTASTFNGEGVITGSIIDASQTDVNFSKEGKITSDIMDSYKTKNELGDAYGMRKASSIDKEWNEQADFFAKYIVGKNLDEVKGIAVNEEGVPTEEDMTSSVTIHVGDFMTILEKAYNTAK